VPRPKAQPPSWQRDKLTECLNLYTSEVQLKVANEGHGNIAELDYPVVHSD
jgi:hypothetical protein